MKRLYQLKRSLIFYTNRVAMNKERLLNKNNSKRTLDRAKVSVRKYEKKILSKVSEIETHLAGRKKVKRIFKTSEEKPATIRRAVEMANDSKQWLKPLSKNNLENKEMIKPRYF
jgi:hypothetical protein